VIVAALHVDDELWPHPPAVELLVEPYPAGPAGVEDEEEDDEAQ